MKHKALSWPTLLGILFIALTAVPGLGSHEFLKELVCYSGLLFLLYGCRSYLVAIVDRIRPFEQHMPPLFLLYHLYRIWIKDLTGVWFVLAGIVELLLVLLLASLVVGWYVTRWREVRPFRQRFFHRLLVVVALFLALLGALTGEQLLLLPALAPVAWDWIRRPAVQGRLKIYTPLLVVSAVALMLHGINAGLEDSVSNGSTISASLGGELSSFMQTAPLPTLTALAEGWLFLITWLSVLVLVGSLVRHAGIRTKLTANALLSSLLPMVVLLGVAFTIALLLMGAYRARLVLMQSEQQLEQQHLVTAWFAEAMENPLDQEAHRRFERQLSSLTIGALPQAFFSLYLPDPASVEGDSLQQWRFLTSTWQRPSDFPMQTLSLPSERAELDPDGLMVINEHLYSVSLVERGGLLAVGFFLRSQENLEDLGRELAAAMRVDQIADGDLPQYALHRMGFGASPGLQELVATPDYPAGHQNLLDRLRVAGMTRLDNGNFMLDDPESALVATVQSFPQAMMRTVFFQNEMIGASYVLLMLIELMLVLPLLLGGIWVAWLLNRQIDRSVHQLKRGTYELAQGNLDHLIEVETTDELGQLASSFNTMSRRIRANIDELAQKERLERDLELARRIQRGLLPQSAPRITGLSVAGANRMAQAVGGDYYDGISSQDQELALALGDASGKGVPASLLMSNLQAAWRALAASGLDMQEVNRRLNEQLASSTTDEMFVTFFQCRFHRRDTGGFRLTYSNAGHNPPLLLRKGELIELGKGGMALGMFGGMPYEQDELDFMPGDRLLLYTDGINETMNPAGEEYGEERIREYLRCCGERNVRQLVDQLMVEVERFQGEAPVYDDQTLLAIHCDEGMLTGTPEAKDE